MHLPAVVIWLVFAAACLGIVAFHRDRLLTVILTGVVGLIVALGFFQFSAPDLALTQISVEIVTTILLLLVLNLLPKETPKETGGLARLRDGSVAALVGLGVAALAYAVLTRDFASISAYHLAESKPGGGGTNVVNVILVDFRGFDTFGEIIVLGIAAIAIFAILDSAMKGEAARRLDAMRPAIEAKDKHPLILQVAARALLPLVLTVGVYVFLRGHNMPGGGFIAGLIFAIAYIMQYMAGGYRWAVERRRSDPHLLIGAGIGIAGLTGIGSWFFGRPFLTSAYDYFRLPVIGEFELASAVAFDVGVALTVVGSVMLALAQISRVEERAARVAPAGGPQEIPIGPGAAAVEIGAASERRD